MIVALISVLGLAIAAYYISKKLKYRGLNLPPQVPALVPFVGSGISFATGPPLKFATECYRQYGEVFTMEMFGKRITFLAGSEAHSPFFKQKDEIVNQDNPYRFCVPIFGEGVVYDAPAHIRIQQMRFVSQSLRGDALASYVPKIVKECEDYFKEKWNQPEGVVDIKDCLAELIILTASRCLMGDEVRERLFAKVAELFTTLDKGLTPISVFFPYLPIPAHRRRDQAREEMVKLFAGIMAERRSKPDVKHEDVLQVFMDSKYRNDQPLTDIEVAGLMIALLFAGQHTSSVTSTWTGLLLCANPQFIPKVIAEQKMLMEKHGGLCFDAIKEMNFLHSCIKEALRMHPPLIFLMREVMQSFKYKDYVIPKGDLLFVSPSLSMRLGDHVNDLGKGTGPFTKPDAYDPERYERREDERQPLSYLAFGAGNHGCIGEKFAYVQIKTIWSVIFKHYDIELVGDLPLPDYDAMVVGPKSPCKIKYKKIDPRY